MLKSNRNPSISSARTRKTAIYVTHDQSAEALRHLRPHRGHECWAGSSRSARRPRSTSIRAPHYVAEFIGANNSLAGTAPSASEGTGEGARVLVVAAGATLRCRRSLMPSPQAAMPCSRTYDRRTSASVEGPRRPGATRTCSRAPSSGSVSRAPPRSCGSGWGRTRIRVDVSGDQRLTIAQRDAVVRLGFDEATLIAASTTT